MASTPGVTSSPTNLSSPASVSPCGIAIAQNSTLAGATSYYDRSSFAIGIGTTLIFPGYFDLAGSL